MLSVNLLGSNIYGMFDFEWRPFSLINSVVPSASKAKKKYKKYKKHSRPKNRFNPRHLLDKIVHVRYPICSTNGESIFLLTYYIWLVRSTWKHLYKEASSTALSNQETNAFKVILFSGLFKVSEENSTISIGNLFWCQRVHWKFILLSVLFLSVIKV